MLGFGRFELQPERRRLLQDGEPVAIGARAFDVLLALVERRDRIVAKAELLDLVVWPGLVVEENNLQVQISSLRKILGSDAIATIPGRGYRFTLGVDAARADGVSTPAVSPPLVAESLIGRDRDVEHLTTLLREHRLVTMLGAAGVGKTTLARAVAQQAVEQSPIVAWVELAPLMDPALIPGAIARALQVPLAGGDASHLLQAVKPLDALVVLDNAEHLVEPLTRLVPALLASGSGLRILMTSQAPLKVDHEWLFRLEPLSCPPADASRDQARTYGAVALFMAQAHASGYRFMLDEHNVGLVVNICRQLDGVALAIKLAAARLPLLGLAGLETGLVQSLKVLGGGARDAVGRRHESLRAAFDWSHDLLAPPERAVFRRLGVFVGGFRLETACAMCTDERLNEVDVIDALGALVDRSFVVVSADAQPHYRLLQVAREYALLQLERSAERPDVEKRHAQAMLTLLEQAYDGYWQQADDRVYESWLSDLDNVRSAVDWSITNDADLAVRLAGELRQPFLFAGRQHELRALSERVEPLVTEATPVGDAAWFWILHGLALLADDREQADAAALRAIELFRRGGDPRKRAVALLAGISDTTLSLDIKEGLLLELRQAIPSHWPAHRRLLPLGIAEAAVAWLRGDRPAARNAYLHVVTMMQSWPGQRNWRGEVLNMLAGTEQVLGLLDDALKHAREALALARGPSNALVKLLMLAGILIERGDLGNAREALVEAVALSRRAGWSRMGLIARRFACLADREGRSAHAARLRGYLRRLNIRLDPLTQAAEVHMQLLGEAAGAALAPDERERLMAEGALLDEATVCELGLSKPAVVNHGV